MSLPLPRNAREMAQVRAIESFSYSISRKRVANEVRKRVTDIAPGGGSCVQFEKVPILHVLHLREPDATIYSGPEHFLNLACWYWKQDRFQKRAIEMCEESLRLADELTLKDPCAGLVPRIKARLTRGVFASKKNDHAGAFIKVYEANKLMDSFWEQWEDAILPAAFWEEFADLKGRVIKTLAFESEFLKLPRPFRALCWAQCEKFFADNEELLEPEPPEEYAPMFMIGDQNVPEFLKPKGIPNDIRKLPPPEVPDVVKRISSVKASDEDEDDSNKMQHRLRNDMFEDDESDHHKPVVRSPTGTLKSVQWGEDAASRSRPESPNRPDSPNFPILSLGNSVGRYTPNVSPTHSSPSPTSAQGVPIRSMGSAGQIQMSSRLSRASSGASMLLGRLSSRGGKRGLGGSRSVSMLFGDSESNSENGEEYRKEEKALDMSPEGISARAMTSLEKQIRRNQFRSQKKVKKQELKVQGLYPGKRLLEEDILAAQDKWMKGKSMKKQTQASKKQKTQKPKPEIQKRQGRGAEEVRSNKNCFESFKTDNAANSKRYDAKGQAHQVAATKEEYRRWKFQARSKGRQVLNPNATVEDLFLNRVYYSGEGLASLRRRRALPGMRAKDEVVQQNLLLGGKKLHCVDLKLVMSHYCRLRDFDNLKDENAKRRALQAMKSENEHVELQNLRKEFKNSEVLYDRFVQQWKLRGGLKKVKSGQNKKAALIGIFNTASQSRANLGEVEDDVGNRGGEDLPDIDEETSKPDQPKVRAVSPPRDDMLDFVKTGIGAAKGIKEIKEERLARDAPLENITTAPKNAENAQEKKEKGT